MLPARSDDYPGRERSVPPGSPALPLAVAGVLWAADIWRLSGKDPNLSAKAGIGLADFCFIVILVFAAFSDWRRLIIPNALSMGGTAVGLVLSLAVPSLHFPDGPMTLRFGSLSPWLDGLSAALIGALAGLGVGLAARWLGSMLLRKRIAVLRSGGEDIDSALGLGDVKLLACIGAFLGWAAIPPTLLAAAVLASLVGSLLRLLGGDPGEASGLAALKARWRSGRGVFPFGPFLAAGALAALFFEMGNTVP